MKSDQDIVTKQEILKLAELANLIITEQEAEKYRSDVGSILGMFKELQEIDTDGVDATFQVSGNSTRTRPDIVSTSDLVTPKELLCLNHEILKQQIKVKKVL
ncbi:Asp-tRNA(Asn)/Glu-tRNA(Gln) amidotransferase subunit GatC [Candidatus Saccharibacteria bacterium]|jgi:aspartyl/glutamyl-tRNA(Asn/Gln) amidotransferase C subunit|nr:Asp-tRNA(Asn)/Glu-tRNA(Gln) amidotransferase subunit GatC [Candidatus Saccharibacteria bacterium]